MLNDTQYGELVQKLAAEIIDDAVTGVEKNAAEKNDDKPEKEAGEQNEEALVKQALAVLEESQIMKQAASEAIEEAELNEAAAYAVLDQLGIDLDELETEETDEEALQEDEDKE